MLLSGCCAVSVQPAVCVWKRSCWARGFVAPKRSRMMRAHRRRAARNLAISSRKSLCALKKNDRRWPNASTSRPGVDGGLHVGDGVGQREGHFLDRRRAGLADVVAADRDRVPLRHVRARRYAKMSVTRRIDGRGGKMYVPRATYSLRMSFWTVPDSVAGAHALPPRHRDVQRQQDARRRVDRHRRRDLVERDAVEQAAPCPRSSRWRRRPCPLRRAPAAWSES